MKRFLNSLVRFFMEGVVIVLPFGLTIALTVYTFRYTQSMLASFFAFFGRYWPILGKVNTIPYLNIGVVLLFLTCLGYIASTFLIRSVINAVEGFVMRIPLVNILYSCIKDSTSALIDKFDKPVLITFNKELDLKKMGFVTQETLDILPESTKVAVYIPHSYAFSGELFLVEKNQIEYLSMSTSDALRLILSGGLANIASCKYLVDSKNGGSLNPSEENLKINKDFTKAISKEKSVD